MGRMITLEADGPFDAYVVEPEGAQPPRGGLVVIHEIWGLVDHIKDVADRFAREGYVVVAPDLLSRVGVRPQLGQQLQEIMFSPDERVRSEGQPRLREATAPTQAPRFAAWAITALRAAIDWLEETPGVGNRVAVTGFCFGGTYAFALAAEDPRIRAAVPFYGAPPQVTETDKITAPVLAFYGDRDERLMTSLPEVEQTLRSGGVSFTSHVYAGAGHAFFNDTNPRTYVPAAAADAWTRALGFLDRAVGSPDTAAPVRANPVGTETTPPTVTG
jgi:carboxymethylenebutenolidase